MAFTTWDFWIMMNPTTHKCTHIKSFSVCISKIRKNNGHLLGAEVSTPPPPLYAQWIVWLIKRQKPWWSACQATLIPSGRNTYLRHADISREGWPPAWCICYTGTPTACSYLRYISVTSIRNKRTGMYFICTGEKKLLATLKWKQFFFQNTG